MRRTLAAMALPALAVSFSWIRLEDPRRLGEVLAVAALALAPALLPRPPQRALGAAAAAVGAGWIAFGAQPWELLPFRDERVLAPVADTVRLGIGDFYGVVLPFDPARQPEMHALLLVAVFGFVCGTALAVAARRAVGAAAVTVAGAGWPATLLSGREVAIGALALAAALSIPLVLRARSAPSLVAGAVTAALVVSGAAWASSVTAVARDAALNWESWDFRGAPARAFGVKFVWDSNYDGIRFPPTETVVLTVRGPDRARYWRVSTLDLFVDDRWFEDLLWLAQVDADADSIPLDRLTPARARRPENWLEQRIEVKALVDDHLAAAGTPVAVDASTLGTVFALSGGVLRARDLLDDGRRYRVWSYAPNPAPAVLSASKPRYPGAADRYLEVGSRVFPAFGLAGRDAVVRSMLRDPAYPDFAVYERLYNAARRIAGPTSSPYAAVLALESWLRQRGRFRYDEQPPRIIDEPPLVGFVTRTRAGYCQQFAGAMALMLRFLGIPARVAVGFTSGDYDGAKWIVTDHDAHAWIEVWFEGQGWVPFDPTPGRGTFAGTYSFASSSEEAVAALGRGELDGKSSGPTGRDIADSADIPRGTFADREGPSIFGLALALAALWAIAVGVGKAAVRRARYLTRNPRRAAAATRWELESFLRDQGIRVPKSATLEDLRRAVGEEVGLDGRAFADAAGRGRFGPPHDASRAAEAARKELRTLLKRLRWELSLWERFRGFVSLRSLRSGWEG